MIYYIECNGYVKIGYTREGKKKGKYSRLVSLQIGNPRTLYLLGEQAGSMDLEKALHAEFGRMRVGGEWFRIWGKLADYLDGKGMLKNAIGARGYMGSERYKAVEWTEATEPLRLVPKWQHEETINTPRVVTPTLNARPKKEVPRRGAYKAPREPRPRHHRECFEWRGGWRCHDKCQAVPDFRPDVAAELVEPKKRAPNPKLAEKLRHVESIGRIRPQVNRDVKGLPLSDAASRQYWAWSR